MPNKIDGARRKFMTFLPVAPVAAMAAAKEAIAARMGLMGPIGYRASSHYADVVGIPPCSNNEPWFEYTLKNFFTNEEIERRRRHAQSLSRVLDPDLAAHRSLSPAVAYGIQIERCIKRIEVVERRDAEKARREALGRGLLS